MYEMTIRLRADSEKKLYEQIYEHIRNEIKGGKLLFGERLPSTRSLAEYLQVSRSTVDAAYGQLLDEGYIESRPCRGFFVCSGEETLGGFAAEKDGGSAAFANASWLSQLRAHTEGNTRADLNSQSTLQEPDITGEVVKLGNEIDDENDVSVKYDFSPYAIDMDGFPVGTWKKISRSILSEANNVLFLKGEVQGDPALRETIARYLHSSRGVDCSPEQIIIGAGNDYLLLLLEKILGRHVRIAMENPTYLRPYRIFQNFAYDVVTVDMDEAGMRADALASADVRAAYVMPSHQFPSGVIMPIRRRMELLKWAAAGEDRYLIEDDYDSEFRFRGKPIPALLASDQSGSVIYLGSFSKSIAPAIRVSFLVLPPKLLAVYRKECSFYSCTVSRIDQSILNVFIRDGYFERHLNKMRKIYRGKHDMLLELLGPFREEFQITGENAGLHFLLTSKSGMSERSLVELAAAQGVKVYGLSQWISDETKAAETAARKNGTVLLGFGGMSEMELCEGVEKLKDAWTAGSRA